MVLGNEVRDLVDAFSELVTQHVRLAQLELKQDARFVGLRVGVIAIFAPLILVGYCFLCIALALSLRAFIGDAPAFVVVGVFNLLAAGIGIAIAGRQLSNHKMMPATQLELESSSAIMVPQRQERR